MLTCVLLLKNLSVPKQRVGIVHHDTKLDDTICRLLSNNDNSPSKNATGDEKEIIVYQKANTTKLLALDGILNLGEFDQLIDDGVDGKAGSRVNLQL